MRYFFIIWALLVLLGVSLAGFRGSFTRKPPIEVFPDMDRQPKLQPEHPYRFFPDRMSSRLPVPGTIAMGDRYEDIPANTGRVPGTTNFVSVNPFPITEQLLARGQERFQIYCLPCHGPLADGNGVTKKLGMAVLGNLHDPRIVRLSDGELFYVITNGRNLMLPYGPVLPPEDRWAVIAYVRALQLSTLATVQDVPEQFRSSIK